jgi:hypothetical protein
MLTITPPMIYHTQGEHANRYTTNDLPHSNPLYISGKLITVNTQINAMFGLT